LEKIINSKIIFTSTNKKIKLVGPKELHEVSLFGLYVTFSCITFSCIDTDDLWAGDTFTFGQVPDDLWASG